MLSSLQDGLTEQQRLLARRIDILKGRIHYQPISERPDYQFKYDAARQLLQGEHYDPQLNKWWKTRKWFISEHATDSEIVQTFLKLCLTSAEHEAREHFFYNGRTVYGPHMSIEELWNVAENEDVRPDFQKQE